MTSLDNLPMRLQCPDYNVGICNKAGCPQFLQDVTREGIDDDGNQLYGGRCIVNGETEAFHDIPEKLFCDARQVVETISAKKVRAKGTCSYARRRLFSSAYAGKKHKSFQIAEDSSSITVNKRVFKLSRQADVTIADHAFRYASDTQNGFTIPFSSKDYNSLSKECKEFVKIWIEREGRKGLGNKRYTDYARFRTENLI